jgi:hypothetical protein
VKCAVFAKKKAEEHNHALRSAICLLEGTPIMVWFFAPLDENDNEVSHLIKFDSGFTQLFKKIGEICKKSLGRLEY